jgi:hypothetical protein
MGALDMSMDFGGITIMHNGWMQTMGVGRPRHLRVAFALAVAGAVLSGCGTDVKKIFGEEPKEVPLPTIGDRFVQLFGGKTVAVGEAAPAAGANGVDCPPVNIRAGASTYQVALPGKQPIGSDLRFQATITRTARDCMQNGDQITARIGIEGRLIVGPAGAPPAVEIPIRVAVVQGGVREKPIVTKVFRTTVPITEGGSVPFSLVGEGIEYPAPPEAVAEAYIFYIGFDPQALTPEAPAKPARKKK